MATDPEPKITVAEVLLNTPEQQRLLPEGIRELGPNRVSWVAIQHREKEHGSLNILDIKTLKNESFDLPGRGGFANPIPGKEGEFIVGYERTVAHFDVKTKKFTVLTDQVDADVSNTIINDGCLYKNYSIFGCKELTFSIKKAGLWLLNNDTKKLTRLRGDQICSNGKAIIEANGSLELIDIDTPTGTVVAYPIDLESGKLGEERILVDMRGQNGGPDGMCLTPDKHGIIVCIYKGSGEFGEARWYDIASGRLRHTWQTPKSPRNTCPALVIVDEERKLVMTTADNWMSKTEREKSPNAGCLFIAPSHM